MKTSLQNIGDLFAEPSALFTRLKSEPRCLLVFVLICLTFLFIGWGRLPFEEQLVAQSGIPIDTAGIRTGVAVIFAIMGCVWLQIAVVLLGALLTVAARLFKISAGIKFHHIYASLMHLALIRGLGELVNTGLLMTFREVTDVKTRVEMQLLPGLHQLAFFLENVKLKMFLGEFHIFALWELACLFIAIRVVAEVSRLQAVLTTVGIWILNLVLSVIFLMASAS